MLLINKTLNFSKYYCKLIYQTQFLLDRMYSFTLEKKFKIQVGLYIYMYVSQCSIELCFLDKMPNCSVIKSNYNLRTFIASLPAPSHSWETLILITVTKALDLLIDSALLSLGSLSDKDILCHLFEN